VSTPRRRARSTNRTDPIRARSLRIISGGQTGADRAALDCAIELGIPHGGWCPKSRRAEDGPIPTRYRVRETASADYRVRTRRNVADGDGTLIFARGDLSGGTLLTAEVARRLGKPLLIIEVAGPTPPEDLAAWMERNRIRTLNVAGPRESEAPGMYAAVRSFLGRALSGCATGEP
jgi:hypothetical protein